MKKYIVVTDKLDVFGFKRGDIAHPKMRYKISSGKGIINMDEVIRLKPEWFVDVESSTEIILNSL